jgi:hypothetical protein
MRRFLIRNAADEQVGEGCATSDRCWIVYQLLSDEPQIVNLRQLRFDASGEPDSIRGNRIDWLDPEPGVTPDGHLWCRGRELIDGLWRWTNDSSCSRCGMEMPPFPQQAPACAGKRS